MVTANEIRQQFIDFFVKKHGHTFVPSSSVVPLDDSSLLFTNAGMNQFKDVFLGIGTRPYKRAVDTQKCIRAGGKHNDLDDVGKDTYHHTFFEMLGNWSFGDYFKKDAIAWAWELLTEVWGLEKSRLHATVFEGDASEGLAPDDEAMELWRTVTDIDPKHIHKGRKKDNFWEMGETGPCGPCSEIHIDRTPDKSGGKWVNAGRAEVIEIWNLVFIQFNRGDDRKLTPLPAKHVDTGMGFERTTAVLQGKTSNYDTDIFAPLFNAIQKVTGAKDYTGKLDDQKDIAYRVIADHARMATFAITDGARPGNKERDSVLRSVIRRAVRFGYQVFDLKEPFLYRLVPVIVDQMGKVFPELTQSPSQTQEVVRAEEEDFLKVIARGIELFRKIADATRQFANNVSAWQEQIASRVLPFLERVWQEQAQFGFRIALIDANDQQDLKTAKRAWNEMVNFQEKTAIEVSAEGVARWIQEPRRIPGEAVFKLHSTYGFPADLSQVMALEMGLAVDLEWFRHLQDVHTTISRGDGGPGVSAIFGELPVTDDSPKYQALTTRGTVLGWAKGNQVFRSGVLKPGEEVSLLLDRTNFYAEQGGQVGDTGSISTSTGRFEVSDTKKLGTSIAHIGRVVNGQIESGQEATLEVSGVRPDIMRNHTATHLLNWALRKVLGDHVEQKGSLVDPDKTRFDFAHPLPLTPEEVAEIERLVNEKIYADLPVTPVTLPLGEAKKIAGVRAVFGEKYPDPVRVLLIGPERPEQVTPEHSVEFCGGTHLKHTGQAGLFKIIGQEAVGKGVRRVTAVTGREAVATVQRLAGVVDNLVGRFNCKPDELAARVDALLEEIKKLQQQLKKGAAGDLQSAADKLLACALDAGGAKIIVGEMPAAPEEQMRQQIDRLRQKAGSTVIVLGWADDGKVQLIAAVTDDLVKKGVKAGTLVGEAAKVVGGKGGGRPTLAQAGGKEPGKLAEALQLAKKLAEEQLGP